MNFKCNRKSVLFLIPILKISAFCGLTPNYSFRRYKVVFKESFKYYSIFLAFLMTVLSGSCLTLRVRGTYNNTVSFQSTVDFVQEISSLMTFLVTTLGASFWNTALWQKFINQLRVLENENNLNTDKPQTGSFFKNATFIFLLGTIFYISLAWYESYVINYLKLSMSLKILNYLIFVLTTLLFNIALSIKGKYKEINKLIVTCGDLDKVKRLYLKIDEVLDKFNSLFGWSILGVLSNWFCYILYYLTILIYTPDRAMRVKMLGIILSHAVSVSFGPVMLLFSCDLAVAEARKLLTNCYKLQQYLHVDSMEHKELVWLENLFRSKPPIFTAAGFFQVNRSTLLYLLSTVTTYFIVAIQFKNK